MSNVVTLEVVDRARSEATRLLAKRLRERQTAELAATMKNRARRLTRLRTFWTSISVLAAAAAAAVGYHAGIDGSHRSTPPAVLAAASPMPAIPKEPTMNAPAPVLSAPVQEVQPHAPQVIAQEAVPEAVPTSATRPADLPAGAVPSMSTHPSGQGPVAPKQMPTAPLPEVPLPAKQKAAPMRQPPSPPPTLPDPAEATSAPPKSMSGIYERSAPSPETQAVAPSQSPPKAEKEKAEVKQQFQVVGVPDDQMILVEALGTVRPIRIGSRLPDGRTLKRANPANGSFEAQ
jgi:hypothetical protein